MYDTATDFSLDHEANGSVLVLRPAGELDMAAEPTLMDLLRVVTEGNWSEVRVELAAVSFMDSTGCNFLLRLRRALPERTARLVVRNPVPAVRTILHVTRMHHLIPIEYDD